MTELMQKTKKELIAMFQDMETAAQSDQKMRQQMQSQLEKAHTENLLLRNEIKRFQEEHVKLSDQIESLNNACAMIEKREQEYIKKNAAAYELFNSFVDSDSKKIILIDTAYTICYLNRSAATHLRLADAGQLLGRRVFDFFSQKDALKIKKKIDAAFFSGEKEKSKDMAFMAPKNMCIQVDLKFVRVRYKDKPSIKITIK
jgi:transcriptional regulator with PAS, ATPase and Fis domain